MLFRAGETRPWIVTGSMGGDAQPQIHAQVVSALVDGGGGRPDGRRRHRAGSSNPPTTSGPRWRSAWSHASPPSTAPALEALGHPVTLVAPFDSGLGHAHAIELVDGGPASPDGSVAAATDPRSAGLPAVW